MLSDIAAGDGPSRLKDATPLPQRRALAFTVQNKTYHADLYLPGEAIGARLLLLPGAVETGKDDPRLVAFAMTLARVRFAVLVPDLSGLRSMQIKPAHVGEIVEAFSHLDSLSELGPARTGIAAVSYAAGPAILAALDPQVRGQVAFVAAISGYYDLTDVLTFITTGYYRDDRRWRSRQPNAYGKWVFVASYIDHLQEAQDRTRFAEIVARKLADTDAPIDDLSIQLTGPDARTLLEIVTNHDPQRIPLLVDQLPKPVQADLNALNLADKNLKALDADLILIHGRDDAIIPFTQSQALAQAAPAERTALFIIDGLAHVEVGPDIRDYVTLWRAAYTLLGKRE